MKFSKNKGQLIELFKWKPHCLLTALKAMFINKTRLRSLQCLLMETVWASPQSFFGFCKKQTFYQLE